MIRLDACHYATLTFPDEPILAMSFNPDVRTFVIGIAGAHIDPDILLEGVRVELTQWTDLSIQHRCEGGALSIVQRLPDELADICEFELREGRLRLAGFLRKAHGWFELTFINPNIIVEYASKA